MIDFILPNHAVALEVLNEMSQKCGFERVRRARAAEFLDLHIDLDAYFAVVDRCEVRNAARLRGSAIGTSHDEAQSAATRFERGVDELARRVFSNKLDFDRRLQIDTVRPNHARGCANRTVHALEVNRIHAALDELLDIGMHGPRESVRGGPAIVMRCQRRRKGLRAISGVVIKQDYVTALLRGKTINTRQWRNLRATWHSHTSAVAVEAPAVERTFDLVTPHFAAVTEMSAKVRAKRAERVDGAGLAPIQHEFTPKQAQRQGYPRLDVDRAGSEEPTLRKLRKRRRRTSQVTSTYAG